MHKRGSYIATMRAQYRCEALKRNLSWQLTRDEFEAIVVRPCAYCGAEPQVRYFSVWNARERKSHRTESKERLNGIDRVDNAIGYTPENCVPCCGKCNALKSDLSIVDLVEHIAKILKRAGGA